MKNRLHVLSVCCASVLLLGAVPGVAAESDAAGAEPKELSRIRVEDSVDEPGYAAKRSTTGTKTDTPMLEVPQSISVITAERIQTIDASRVSEALSYTPGVGVGVWGSDTRFDWLSLRGFDAYSPGYYLDGLILRNIGTWAVWRTENYGAERIEVLRGPASVLYGQGSPGGMINFVSKRPSASAVRELQVQIGDHERRQVAADFSSSLDEDAHWLYRLTGSVRDAEVAEMGEGLRDDWFYLAPSLTWQPSDDTTLTVLSHMQRTRTVPSYRGLPAQGTLLSNPNGRIATDTYTGEPDFDDWDHRQWMLGYAFEHRFSDVWTVRQNARYGRLDLDYQQVWALGSFVTVNTADADDPANFRRVDRFVFGSDEQERTFAVDNQAQLTMLSGGGQHTLLFGLDHERSTFEQITFWGGSAGTIDVYTPVYGQAVYDIPEPYFDGTTRLTQTGLYVQDQIKWGEHWAATLGGRYDIAKLSSDNRSDASSSRQTDREFSGRAGLVYLAGNGWAPYIGYSESFSPIATIDPETGKPFDPETGRQYEAGVRYQPAAGGIYSIAAFDLRRQNYVTTDTNFVSRQTGEITSRGVELEALLQPLPALNVNVAYTWLPKVEVTASSNPEEVGRQAQGVPEHQLSLWTDYRFDSGIKAGLGARHVGSTRGYGETAPVPVPDYTLIDAMLGYAWSHWEVALNARNLTDKIALSANCNEGSCQYNGRRKVTATAMYRW